MTQHRSRAHEDLPAESEELAPEPKAAPVPKALTTEEQKEKDRVAQAAANAVVQGHVTCIANAVKVLVEAGVPAATALPVVVQVWTACQK